MALLANTSHSVVGQATGVGASRLRLRMPSSFSLGLPVWLMPVRSPFTSAGEPNRHPIWLKPSASFCSVMVFARAGGPGDQAVAVGQGGQQFGNGVTVAGEEDGVGMACRVAFETRSLCGRTAGRTASPAQVGSCSITNVITNSFTMSTLKLTQIGNSVGVILPRRSWRG